MCKTKLPVVVMVILSIYLKFLNVSKIDREGGKLTVCVKMERGKRKISFSIFCQL